MYRRGMIVRFLAGLAILAALAHLVDNIARRGPWWAGTDFAVYWWASYFWRTGQPLYTGLPAHPEMTPIYVYAYPPTLAVLFVPLTFLPYEVAWWLCGLTFLAGALTAVWLTLTLIGLRGLERLVLFAAFLWFPPLHYEAALLNVNLVVLAGLALAWAMRRRDEGWAALLAGLAVGFLAGIKLHPALMLVPLLMRPGRRPLVLAGFAGGLVPAAVALALTAHEFRAFLWVLSGMGLTWTGLPLPADLSVWGSAIYWLGPQAGPVVAALVAAGLLTLAGWLSWPRREQVDEVWSLWLVVLLLVSPVTWPQYFILLALPLFLVWRRARANWPASRGVVRGLLLTAILMCLPPVTNDLPGWVNLLSTIGQAVGLWLCFGLVLVVLFRRGGADEGTVAAG